MSADTTPSLERLLFDFADARLADVWTGQPGRIERYDAAKQRADVQPLVKGRFVAEDGTVTAELLPIVPNVPVVMPGGGGFGATFPVAVGDTVWLAHASSSMDRWQERGGAVDPADDRRHALTDAVAIVGLRDFAHPRANAPTDRARFGKDGGVALEVTATEVLVGGGPSATHSPTFRADFFLAAFDTLMASVATAVGTSGTPAGATAAAAAISAAVVTFHTDLNTTNGYTSVTKVR